MIKYMLCFLMIAFVIADGIIFLNLKKYLKLHENELVENHIKGLLARAIAMTIISLCVGIMGVIVQII